LDDVLSVAKNLGVPGCPGCEQLSLIVEELRAEVKELKARVTDLEAELKQTSRNSHKPPSSDLLGSSAPKKSKGKRRRGGQPGREGKNRDLMPIEAVDEVIDCKAEVCVDCHAELLGADPNPIRFQVMEIPELAGHLTEYRLHVLTCACGATNPGTLPPGVRESAFGPRLQSAISVLTGAYRLSKRNAQALLQDFFGIDISLGSICNTEKVMSAALDDPVEEARDHVRLQGAAHVDETGFRQENKRVWLWNAVAGTVAVYAIRASRGSKVAKEILGELFSGIAITDRWSAYTWLPVRQRQLCWAHLIRDFRKIEESGRTAAWVGEDLGGVAATLFDYWYRVRDGTLARSTFRKYVGELRREVKRLLRHGAALANVDPRTAAICKELLKLEPAMWTFARVEGVEPTNNNAERALRHAVIWRKTSFGTQSEEGSRYVERILTAVSTLRLQGRNVLEYLVEARQAAIHRRAAPTLVGVSS
jgi:transposase